MGDAIVVRRLVEMLSAFFHERKTAEEDLTYSLTLTSEFLQNMQDVLFTKRMVSIAKFRNLFSISFERMLLSTEIYLRYVFYACLLDALVNLNIFERFLSALAIILRVSYQTSLKSGMNFCQLVPDVFMVFYEKELKEPFVRRGGFQRFVKYINDPKYLDSKCIARNLSGDLIVSGDIFSKDLSEKLWRLFREEPELPKGYNFVVPELDPRCKSLAKTFFETTKTKFTSFPSNDGLKVNLSDLTQLKITQLEKRILEASEVGVSELTFESCSPWISDSKTDDSAVVQVNDNEWYASITEAVIRHNNSKSSCHVKSNDRIQTEADKYLEHIKSKIQSLIRVLDEHDKE